MDIISFWIKTFNVSINDSISRSKFIDGLSSVIIIKNEGIYPYNNRPVKKSFENFSRFVNLYDDDIKYTDFKIAFKKFNNGNTRKLQIYDFEYFYQHNNIINPQLKYLINMINAIDIASKVVGFFWMYDNPDLIKNSYAIRLSNQENFPFTLVYDKNDNFIKIPIRVKDDKYYIDDNYVHYAYLKNLPQIYFK